MKFNVKDLVAVLIGVLTPLIPFLGAGALSAAERAATIPEKDVRAMCAGMSEADIKVAIDLARKMGDSVSDFSCFVASRGSVRPD